jgi:hypothetical protein
MAWVACFVRQWIFVTARFIIWSGVLSAIALIAFSSPLCLDRELCLSSSLQVFREKLDQKLYSLAGTKKREKISFREPTLGLYICADMCYNVRV